MLASDNKFGEETARIAVALCSVACGAVFAEAAGCNVPAYTGVTV
jgi:hypothetical protein